MVGEYWLHSNQRVSIIKLINRKNQQEKIHWLPACAAAAT